MSIEGLDNSGKNLSAIPADSSTLSSYVNSLNDPDTIKIAGAYDKFTTPPAVAKTNQDIANEQARRAAAGAPADQPPAGAAGGQPPRAQCDAPPAPQPACPADCHGVQTPDGYQVVNPPLQPGQVMRTPDNWNAAGNQTNQKIGSDTTNYEKTNTEDGRGKELQNDAYKQQIENEKNIINAQIENARRQSKSQAFATDVGAVGGLLVGGGAATGSILNGVAGIRAAGRIGGVGGYGYGYGGGYGGGYGMYGYGGSPWVNQGIVGSPYGAAYMMRAGMGAGMYPGMGGYGGGAMSPSAPLETPQLNAQPYRKDCPPAQQEYQYPGARR